MVDRVEDIHREGVDDERVLGVKLFQRVRCPPDGLGESAIVMSWIAHVQFTAETIVSQLKDLKLHKKELTNSLFRLKIWTHQQCTVYRVVVG